MKDTMFIRPDADIILHSARLIELAKSNINYVKRINRILFEFKNNKIDFNITRNKLMNLEKIMKEKEND